MELGLPHCRSFCPEGQNKEGEKKTKNSKGEKARETKTAEEEKDLKEKNLLKDAKKANQFEILQIRFSCPLKKLT